MQKKGIKSKFKLLLWGLFTLMGFIIVNSTSASASTRKCYTILPETTKTFSDSDLTKETGEIWENDEITVLDVHDKYSQVKYPISGGKQRTAYIPTNAILTSTSGTNTKAKKEIETFRRPGGKSYGHIDKNDTVMVLGISGNYTQVKYPVPSGYKYAFVTTYNANKYLLSSTSSNSVSIANGTYKLVSALNNSYVWDIAGASILSEANLQLYEDNNSVAQQFVFTKEEGDYYSIYNINSKKMIDCYGGHTTNGTNIWQYDNNNSDSQRWKLIDAGNGYYYLQCKCNGLMADVSGGAVYNGNNIQMYEYNATASQKFKLVPINSNSNETDIINKIVNFELSQLGIGDKKGNNDVIYNTWYYGNVKKGAGRPWCMTFQAYSAYKVGRLNISIPKYASCTQAVKWYKERGLWHFSKAYGGNYSPKAGDLVFYTEDNGKKSSHVGMIISDPVNGYLQTVEGNIKCSDGNFKVVKFTKNKKRTVSNKYVYGYASPNY